MDQQEESDMEEEEEEEEEVHSPIAPWLLTISSTMDESDSSEGIHSTRHAQLARSPQSYLRQAGAFDYFKEPASAAVVCRISVRMEWTDPGRLN